MRLMHSPDARRQVPVDPGAGQAERDDMIVERVVARLSRGNVSLQVGRTVTETDLAEGRQRVQSYRWDSPVGQPARR